MLLFVGLNKAAKGLFYTHFRGIKHSILLFCFVNRTATSGDKPGSWGLAATYYDQGATTYIDHTMNGLADSMWGFEGYSVIANYTFAKNIVGQVEWYDL